MVRARRDSAEVVVARLGVERARECLAFRAVVVQAEVGHAAAVVEVSPVLVALRAAEEVRPSATACSFH